MEHGSHVSYQLSVQEYTAIVCQKTWQHLVNHILSIAAQTILLQPGGQGWSNRKPLARCPASAEMMETGGCWQYKTCHAVLIIMMWTRTENQAKHILLNRTRDGMRVQVNVFLMKENDWRLSLGAFIILYPKCFQIEDDSLLFSLTVISSFPIHCSQCLKQQWFTFKVPLEVTVLSEGSLCIRWK